MINLMDIIVDTYSLFMAVINYICFGALLVCLGYIFVMAALGTFSRWYKHLLVAAVGIVVFLIAIHMILLETLGIPVLVPPIDTIYFEEFLKIIQFIASAGIVLVVACIFVCAVLSRLDRSYQHATVSAFMVAALLVIIHFYIEDTFGIKIIFPPNLW